MKQLDFKFFDSSRAREIPVCVYLPLNIKHHKNIVIFSHGYQEQKILASHGNIPGYKKYQYLAEFFTKKNYIFISIQHDLVGDNDGLETIDQSLVQHYAREHLYKRGAENILFVLNAIQKEIPQLYYKKFIICGHSNGGDISKYFAKFYPEMISDVIVLDGRRYRIEAPMKILMFEANDTVTEAGVVPQDEILRAQIELVVIKPKDALHKSYCDDAITDNVKNSVYNSITWFLNL